MQNQSPMPCPSDGPEEIVHEYINLDTMPDEALASLVEIELPNLTPRFGLMPDLASFVDGGPRTPACAPRLAWMRYLLEKSFTGMCRGIASSRC